MTTVRAHAPLKRAPGQTAILGPASDAPLAGQLILEGRAPGLVAGTCLGPEEDHPWLQVTGSLWLPEVSQALRAYVVKALSPCSFHAEPRPVRVWRHGFSLAWITMSDKGASGERPDTSGPMIPELIRATLSLNLVQGFILPDNRSELKRLLIHLALDLGFNMIVTSGGTGVSPRDITPDVTAEILDRRLRGFEQAMLQTSLHRTPHAVISRATAGILGTSLIINLPGSPKGVRENLTPLLPALQHTLDKIHNDPSDCGAGLSV